MSKPMKSIFILVLFTAGITVSAGEHRDLHGGGNQADLEIHKQEAAEKAAEEAKIKIATQLQVRQLELSKKFKYLKNHLNLLVEQHASFEVEVLSGTREQDKLKKEIASEKSYEIKADLIGKMASIRVVCNGNAAQCTSLKEEIADVKDELVKIGIEVDKARQEFDRFLSESNIVLEDSSASLPELAQPDTSPWVQNPNPTGEMPTGYYQASDGSFLYISPTGVTVISPSGGLWGARISRISLFTGRHSKEEGHGGGDYPPSGDDTPTPSIRGPRFTSGAR